MALLEGDHHGQRQRRLFELPACTAAPSILPGGNLEWQQPILDQRGRVLVGLFLRRYVTWCVRSRRNERIPGALNLLAAIGETAVPHHQSFHPDQAVRISAALVKAIAEAKALVEANDFGPDFHEVIRHARELHDLLHEQVTAEPRVVDRLSGLCDAIGENVRRLEKLVEDDQRPPWAH